MPQRRRREPPVRRRERAADGAGRRAAGPVRGRRVRAAGDRPAHAAARAAARRTCSATSSTATASSSWWPSAGARMVAGLPRRDAARAGRRRPGDQLARRRARERASATASTTRRSRSPSLADAADSTTLRALRARLRLRGDLPRAPRRLPLPELRARPAAARRRGHVESSCAASTAAASRSAGRGSSSALPGIYNVYNAARRVRPRHRARRRPAVAAERIGGARAAFGRFERVVVGDRDAVLLLVKNPAGANEALRDAGAEPRRRRAAAGAERPDRRRPRRVVDLGRRLRERAPRAGHVVCSGTRAADMALRAKYAGVPDDRIEIVPGRAEALDRALDRAGSGGTAYVLPTYTAMLELQRVAAERGPRPAVLGGDRPVITIVPVYPTLLSIYADRGNVRVLEQRCALARHRLPRRAARARRRRSIPRSADIILLGGGQDRDQVLVADELIRQTPRDRRGDRRRRLPAGRLRRLPAARPPLPRAPGRRHPRHRPGRPRDHRGRHAPDRQRARRLRRRPDDGRLREPRRAHVARRRRRSRSAG